MIFVKISQNFIKSPLKICLTDFSSQLMACMCEIFTKTTLEFPQNSQTPLFKCKKLVINTSKCDLCFFIKCVIRCSENSVRFDKSYGNWLPDGLNSVRFYLTV